MFDIASFKVLSPGRYIKVHSTGTHGIMPFLRVHRISPTMVAWLHYGTVTIRCFPLENAFADKYSCTSFWIVLSPSRLMSMIFQITIHSPRVSQLFWDRYHTYQTSVVWIQPSCYSPWNWTRIHLRRTHWLLHRFSPSSPILPSFNDWLCTKTEALILNLDIEIVAAYEHSSSNRRMVRRTYTTSNTRALFKQLDCLYADEPFYFYSFLCRTCITLHHAY